MEKVESVSLSFLHQTEWRVRSPFLGHRKVRFQEWGRKPSLGQGQYLTSNHATALPKTQADCIWPTYQSSKFFVNLEFVIPTLQEEKMVLSWKHSRKLEIRGPFFCLFYFVFWWHAIFCLFGFYHLGLLMFSILVFLCYSINFEHMCKDFRGTQIRHETPFYI